MSIGKKLAIYRSMIFDCDGVVLNSNKVKTDAFYQASWPYGEAAAQAMVDYHVANGGVHATRSLPTFWSRSFLSTLRAI